MIEKVNLRKRYTKKGVIIAKLTPQKMVKSNYPNDTVNNHKKEEALC